jgi:N-acetylmuramoyl-L-alanine amidase
VFAGSIHKALKRHMKTHKVQKGDCMSSLAEEYGLHDPQLIYSHTDNAALKTKRTNPNVLYKGDVVKVPDKEPGKDSGGDSKKHRFKAKGLVTHLRFLVEDFDGTAIGNKRYKLEVGGESFEDTTGGDGLVEQMVSASATEGKLTIWLDDEKTRAIMWPLEIGNLDPHEEISGVQARLNNLGFNSGPVDGINGKLTKAAVKDFNAKHSIAGGEVISTDTRNKLKQLYGF